MYQGDVADVKGGDKKLCESLGERRVSSAFPDHPDGQGAQHATVAGGKPGLAMGVVDRDESLVERWG